MSGIKFKIFTSAELNQFNSINTNYIKTHYLLEQSDPGVIPRDLWSNILSYLPHKDILKMRKVSQFFRIDDLKTEINDTLIRNQYIEIKDQNALRNFQNHLSRMPDDQFLQAEEIIFDTDTYIDNILEIIEASPNLTTLGRSPITFGTAANHLNFLKETNYTIPTCIKHIKFTGRNMSPNIITLFLEHAENIEEITFAVNINNIHHELEPGCLSHIKTLNIGGSSNTFGGGTLLVEDFDALMDAAPKIESLTTSLPKDRSGRSSMFIDSYQDPIFTNSDKKRLYPSLKQIKISGQAKPSDIISFLALAPNLEKAHFVPSQSTGNEFFKILNEKKQVFPTLKELNLQKYPLSSKDILLLLKAMPNLEKLHVGGIAAIGQMDRRNFKSLGKNSLQALHFIDLSSTLISFSELEALLEAAPNLREVKLIKSPLFDKEEIDFLTLKYPKVNFVI